MLIQIIATTFLCGAVGLWWLFSRRSPRLTDDILSELPGVKELSSKGVYLHAVSSLSPEARRDVTRAFLSGTDFKWILVGGDGCHPDLDGKGTNREGSEVATNHYRITEYMNECCILVAERFGHIIVCTNSKVAGEGKFLGSICLVPPHRSPKLFFLRFMRCVIPLGKPVPTQISPEAGMRFDAFANATTAGHRRVLGCSPHWYVLNLAVSPEAQGKGVGSRLLQTANAVALAMSGKGVPLFLECRDGNVAFYQKMGFRVKEGYDMVPKIGPQRDASAATPYHYNAMVTYAS